MRSRRRKIALGMTCSSHPITIAAAEHLYTKNHPSKEEGWFFSTSREARYHTGTPIFLTPSTVKKNWSLEALLLFCLLFLCHIFVEIVELISTRTSAVCTRRCVYIFIIALMCAFKCFLRHTCG